MPRLAPAAESPFMMRGVLAVLAGVTAWIGPGVAFAAPGGDAPQEDVTAPVDPAEGDPIPDADGSPRDPPHEEIDQGTEPPDELPDVEVPDDVAEQPRPEPEDYVSRSADPLGESVEASASGPPEEGPATQVEQAPPLPTDRGDYGRDVVVPDQRARPVHEQRASSIVTRREIQERLPRSAPDALIYEPGVYVQRTAHAQASPYVRGLTGQQTFLAFDGVRLNNATFRSGPNQYFFTVDSRTIQSLEVVRGSASTRWGSDAVGGALLSTPIDPTLNRNKRWEVHPKIIGATRSADDEIGGRAQLDIAYKGKVGFIGGVGYRDVGLLETSGPVIAPATGKEHKSPRFDRDKRVQLGTGFREFTADARAVYRPDRNFKLTLAHYNYRQKDAPRTDKCPPDEAPDDQCLVYLDQFRELTYAALETHDGPAGVENARLTVNYQKQHERRQLFKDNGVQDIDGGTELNGNDDVHTAGVSLMMSTKNWLLGDQATYRLAYGGDVYYDKVRSHMWIVFTDFEPDVTRVNSRGQYLDDGNYVTSGVWAQNHMRFWERIALRGGGRLAIVAAQAPGDDETNSERVDKTWVAGVGNAGISVDTSEWLTFLLGFDQGFRAPNLDDLTSRQQTGPGFQFENADLAPEKSHTFELGAKVRHARVEASGFIFQTKIRDLIARAPRSTVDCPAADGDGCASSSTQFQLVNLEGEALLRGADAAIRIYLPAGFGVRATIAYTIGDAPNPVPPPPDPEAARSYEHRKPMSRIPPLNGTAEITWHSKIGIWTGASLRWATLQDRLAHSDVADVRIPAGGTPGFAVFDMRLGYRWDPVLLVGLVFENIADTPYRYHGSSVNGAARSISVQMEVGF